MNPTPHEAVERLLAEDSTARDLGIEVDLVEDGRVVLGLLLDDAMTNGAGVVHGGWVFLLADTAFAYAATTRRPGTLTTDADIRFHRPAFRGDRVTADATIVEEAGASVLVDVAVRSSDGSRLASFRGGGRTPRTPAPKSDTSP